MTATASKPIFAHLRSADRLSFAALTIPIDIKNQYHYDVLFLVESVVMENVEQKTPDGSQVMSVITIEFNDGTFDEWELPSQPNNDWMSWMCWRKSDCGLIE